MSSQNIMQNKDKNTNFVKLDNLSNKILTGLWLLDYDICYDPLSIYNTFYFHKIPIELFYWKLIYRLRVQGKKMDEIYTELIKLGVIDIDNFENDSSVILELIEIINIDTPLKPVSGITNQIISYLDKIINQEINIQKEIHVGQPLPDAKNGRPYIHWKKCYYNNCGKSFHSGQDLISHLEKYGCYSERFHWHHEACIDSQKLTPQKIKSLNIIKCPSMICSKNANIKTCDDVIDHLTELGIHPFWTPGAIIKSKSKIFNTDVKELTDVQVYDSQDCVVCLVDKPNLINLPCHHKIYCLECSQHGQFTKCSLCNRKIDYVIPFN